jgi:hypothetical protein
MSMGIEELSNKELAYLYIVHKQKRSEINKDQSFYDLNRFMEIKQYLSIIKVEMKRRGLKKKEVNKFDIY